MIASIRFRARRAASAFTVVMSSARMERSEVAREDQLGSVLGREADDADLDVVRTCTSSTATTPAASCRPRRRRSTTGRRSSRAGSARSASTPRRGRSCGFRAASASKPIMFMIGDRPACRRRTFEIGGVRRRRSRRRPESEPSRTSLRYSSNHVSRNAAPAIENVGPTAVPIAKPVGADDEVGGLRRPRRRSARASR